MFRFMVLLFVITSMEPNCWMPTSHTAYSEPEYRDVPANYPTSIEGRVYEETSLRPVEGAILALYPPAQGNTGTSAISNSNGDYYFDGLGNGNYMIVANHSAYLAETVTVQTYGDSTVNLDIYMTPSGL
ncbi:exported hypothetical protein [Candidatus Zixiibacteriota bacterium]|nr:exported hypothetical protein [candidate division Zixibacteria bacterium]